MKIAVLGAGNVRGTLGKLLLRLDTKFSLEYLILMKKKTKPNIVSVGSVADAVRSAQLVGLATPWNAARAALQSTGDLTDKIVIDCTNPLKRISLDSLSDTQPLPQKK